jgi:hypothetical protein
MEKKYRLWTFQSMRSIQELKSKGILQASWDRYSPTGTFIKSYQWMVKQIAARKISCNHPPIWAWHSCGKYEKAPTLLDARCLLSDVELEEGIQTIEFECPTEMVLLSNYGVWNMMLHEFFASKEEVEIDQRTQDGLFKVDRKKFKRYDSIQATLPYLKLDWVKAIRVLNLKPKGFSYNQEEGV